MQFSHMHFLHMQARVLHQTALAILSVVATVAGCSGEGTQNSSANEAIALRPKPQAEPNPSDLAEESEPRSWTITCHEMVGGGPSPDITTYALRNGDFFRDDVRISAGNGLLSLGLTTDDEGQSESYARQSIEGRRLTRTVYERRNNEQKIRRLFTEVFDFDRQTVIDSQDGQDTCHHNGKA